MRVFSDMHHMGLYNSLRMLFEDRLGWELYRPIGTDWLNEGYWRMAEIYNNHPATVAQYLGIRPDYEETAPGEYKVFDPQHEVFQKAITLERFKEIKPDVVLASIPDHIGSFKRLAELVGAKMIYQIGNSWPVEAGLAPNIMASAKIAGVPQDVHFIEYHQEFPIEVFHYYPPVESTLISSFINCFNTASIYEKDWPLFESVESLMPDWKFKAYGASCRDEAMNGIKALASEMARTRFVWHTKNGGDGYGHILYNSAAIGRPLIIKKDYYIGKMGEELLEDGKTCITIDGLNPNEIVEKILHYNDPQRYSNLCVNAHNNFNNKVSFEKEELLIRDFVKTLK